MDKKTTDNYNFPRFLKVKDVAKILEYIFIGFNNLNKQADVRVKRKFS